jgi:hypothetical protein
MDLDNESDGQRLEQLLARDDITSLINRLGVILDEGPIEELRSILVQDATARTPGGLAEGIEAVVAQATRNHPSDVAIQHLITNVVIDVQDDRASARANLIAHFTDGGGDSRQQAPAPRYVVGEVYHFEAVQTLHGWRLSHVEATALWSTGERLLPAAVPGTAAVA